MEKLGIDLINKVTEFIDDSDDDEAVELVSTLYMMLVEVSSSATILTVENRLLNRELEDYYDEEEINELNEKIKSDSNLVS
jgi:hypothetical protein